MSLTRHFCTINKDLRDHVAWLELEGVPLEKFLEEVIGQQPAGLPASALRKIQRIAVLNNFFSAFLRKYQPTESWDKLANPDFPGNDYALFMTAILLANTSFAYKKALREVFRILKGGDWALAARLGRADEFESFAVDNAGYIARRFFERFNLEHSAAGRAAVKYIRTVAIGFFLDDSVRRAKSDPTSLIAYLEKSRRVSRRVRIAALIAYIPTALSNEDIDFVRKEYDWVIQRKGHYLIQLVAQELGFRTRAALYTRLYKIRRSAKGMKLAADERAEANFARRCANDAKLKAAYRNLEAALAEIRGA